MQEFALTLSKHGNWGDGQREMGRVSETKKKFTKDLVRKKRKEEREAVLEGQD